MKAIFIQARLSSKRFPGKMLDLIGGIPLVQFVYKRCKRSSLADMVAVITSNNKSDDQLADYCRSCHMEVFRGPLDNVLSRYILAAEHYYAKTICRVCGDSPFVDTELIDHMFRLMENEVFDYMAPDKNNCIAGLDSEIVTLSSLKRSLQFSAKDKDLEHVTSIIRERPKDFRSSILNIDLKPRLLNGVSLTVDYPEDLVFCNKICDSIAADFLFKSADILDLLVNDSDLSRANMDFHKLNGGLK